MTLLFGIARGLDRQQYALQLVTDREHLDLITPMGTLLRVRGRLIVNGLIS